MKYIYIFTSVFIFGLNISYATDVDATYKNIPDYEKKCIENFIRTQIKNRRNECKKIDESLDFEGSTNCYHKAGLIFSSDNQKAILACNSQK